MMIPRGIGTISEHVLATVENGLRDGNTHKEILLKFEQEEDRLMAAALLSTKPRSTDRKAYLWSHRILIGLLILFAIGLIASIEAWADLVIPVGLVLVVLMIRKRNPWGYNGAILFTVWLTIGCLLDIPSLTWTTEDVVILILGFLMVISLGGIAYYLRYSLFPYMGVMGIRRDESGKPALLRVLVEGHEHTI